MHTPIIRSGEHTARIHLMLVFWDEAQTSLSSGYLLEGVRAQNCMHGVTGRAGVEGREGTAWAAADVETFSSVHRRRDRGPWP